MPTEPGPRTIPDPLAPPPRAPLESAPPSASMLPPPPPARLKLYEDTLAMIEHFGEIGRMTGQAFIAMWRRPLEIQSTTAGDSPKAASPAPAPSGAASGAVVSASGKKK